DREAGGECPGSRKQDHDASRAGHQSHATACGSGWSAALGRRVADLPRHSTGSGIVGKFRLWMDRAGGTTAKSSAVFVCSEPVVEPCIVGPEMKGEPVVEALRQLPRGALPIGLVAVHDVADFLEQRLVRFLVRGELVVAVLAHELFLKREMRGDGAQDLPEDSRRVRDVGTRDQALVQRVDEVDELAVLVVYRLDANAVVALPFDQGHRAPPS